MCGLVGAMVCGPQWTLNDSEIKIFNDLLYVSALRGDDSTGVMTWDGNEVRICKTIATPHDFLYSDIYDKFLKGHRKGIKMIFGHTRLATVGKIKAANAHPFRVKDRIILMHNGSVSNVVGETVTEHEVDSMALAHSLAQNSVTDVFEKFDGAVAAIWFDKQERKLRMYRNSQRPLAISDSTVTRYVMSESKMLDSILNRNRMGYQVNSTKIIDINANDLIEVDIDTYEAPKVSKIIRKHDFTPHYGGWSKQSGWQYDDGNYERIQRNGYTELRRHRGKDSSLPALPAVVSSNRHVNFDTKINPGTTAERTFIGLQEHGPFTVNEELTLMVYKTEQYMSNGEEKFKLLCSPLFTKDLAHFDVPEYNAAKMYILNQTAENAKKFMEEEFIVAKIMSILYNRNYRDASEKLVIYLAFPRSIDKANESSEAA